jgi:RNA polymerase sigma-70 factor (ECF subfamily)
MPTPEGTPSPPSPPRRKRCTTCSSAASRRAAELSEVRDHVRACIEQLTESYRAVLLLRDIEEFDTAETARLLDCTPNNVKVRLHRARQALKTLLDPAFAAAE